MTPTENRLLESLSPAILARMLAASETCALPVKMVLYSAGIVPKYGYFLTDGIASLVLNGKDGVIAEVGIVGREGLVSAIHLLGTLPTPTECFMQVAGTGRRILFSELEQCFLDIPDLHGRILEFVQFKYLSASMLAACNALHTVEQRLARWLLMVQDRMRSDTYSLTHEFLAEMLVVQRPTVSIVAATMQREGVIHYRHGQLRILKRESLVASACDCYPIFSNLLQRLYPSSDEDADELPFALHPTLV